MGIRCLAILLPASLLLFGGAPGRLIAQIGLQREAARFLDTNRVVYDSIGKPLRYYQYSQIMQTGDYYLSKDYASQDSRVTLKKSGSLWKERGLTDEAIRKLNEQMNSMRAFIIRDPTYKKPFWGWCLLQADKIIVEKSRRKMTVLRSGKIILEFPVSLGRNPLGHKQREGDGRTPEGWYVLDWNRNTNATYYKAFHISYPNKQDLENAKRLKVNSGANVMIHGTSAKKDMLKNWTNGCIALSNSNLDSLDKYIRNGIPIEIRQ